MSSHFAALFGGQAETGDPSMQTGGAVQVGRRRPLVITVVAVFLLFSSLSIFMLALLPMPMVLFGRVIHGFGGTVLFAVYSAACLGSGIGLLKLKPWAYWLAIGYHAVLVLSAIVSLLSPNYESATQEALASFPWMKEALTPEYLHQLHSYSIFGLLLPVVIVGLLLSYRPVFLKASSIESVSE